MIGGTVRPGHGSSCKNIIVLVLLMMLDFKCTKEKQTEKKVFLLMNSFHQKMV